MKNAKAILGILFIFALGAIIGTLITRMVYEARIEAIVSGDSQARETAIINRWSKNLDLDSKQREEVQVIVHDLRKEMADIRQQVRPQTMAALEKSRMLMKMILRPDQAAKYEKMIAEAKER